MSGGGGQLQAPTLAAQAAQMQNAAYNPPPYRSPATKWEVWFAWHPVKVEVFRKSTFLHDQVDTEIRYERRWLCNVSRRMTYHWGSGDYEYAPAYMALTQ